MWAPADPSPSFEKVHAGYPPWAVLPSAPKSPPMLHGFGELLGRQCVEHVGLG